MEITDEELQKKLDDARKEAITEATKYEQWRNAFAQSLRITFPYIENLGDQYDPQTNQLVKKGIVDAFVVTVFKTECTKILKEYYPEPTEKKI